jgi:hypothetical protein
VERLPLEEFHFEMDVGLLCEVMGGGRQRSEVRYRGGAVKRAIL